MAQILSITPQIDLRQRIPGGWLAISQKPRLGADGRTPEEAKARLAELIVLYRSLAERAANRRGTRV